MSQFLDDSSEKNKSVSKEVGQNQLKEKPLNELAVYRKEALLNEEDDKDIDDALELYKKPEKKDNSVENKKNIEQSNYNIINNLPINIINDDLNNRNNNNIRNEKYLTDMGIKEEGSEGAGPLLQEGEELFDEQRFSEAAAPTFLKTICPEDQAYDHIIAERNEIKDEAKNDDAIKKNYVNTETTQGI